MRPAAGVVCISLLALSVSCRKPVSAMLGQPVELRVQSVATFGPSDLELHFARVVSDSRCPNGAKCIWAGEALVMLEGRISKGRAESIELRLPAGVPDSVIWKPYDVYRIGLVKLEPYPVAGMTPDTTKYVGTFLVGKR